MNILGIIDTKIESGISFYKNKKLEFAISEERISRIKMDGGFPYKSLNYFYKNYKKDLKSIDCIVFAGIVTPIPLLRMFNFLSKLSTKSNNFVLNYLLKKIEYLLSYKLKIYSSLNPNKKKINLMLSFLKFILKKRLHPLLKNKPIYFIDHHLSHACCTYYSSGFNESFIASFDGFGDGASAKFFIGKNNKVNEIFKINALDSFGLYYSLITEYLGFIPEKHEGKITGLAAYGNYKKVKETFPFIFTNQKKIKYLGNFGFRGLKEIENKFSKYKSEDVASWLQYNTEKIICKIISFYMKKYKQKNICLAGGLTANVKINQKIHELDVVNNIYIYPAMSDTGISHGAILSKIKKKEILTNIFYGPKYSNDYIEKIIKKDKIKYKKLKNIEKEIALLLSKGKIVARFNGRMEYGPRALGNRSILVEATNNSINKSLNKKLNRTEFMPFAPTILDKYANKCIKNLKGANLTSKFMNISFKVTNYMKKNFPAAVHVDKTSRPQILSKKDNESYYKILNEYYKITKNPVILNTSFNVHEEPIVMTPNDALRAFKKSNLDYLAIGNFLIKNDI